TLHLFDSTVTNNQSDFDGGGIYNEGTLDIRRVTFSNDYAMADGAAIATKGAGNPVAGSRVAIQSPPAKTTIVNSTFTGNISASDGSCEGGGAIEQQNGNTT